MFGLLALWVSWFPLTFPLQSFPARLLDQQRTRRIRRFHDQSVCVGTAFAVALCGLLNAAPSDRDLIRPLVPFLYVDSDVRVRLGRRGAIAGDFRRGKDDTTATASVCCKSQARVSFLI